MKNIKSMNKIFQGLQIYLCKQAQKLINQIVGDKE
jgi:hypothetical protein